MYCGKCGAQGAEGAIFCSKCGAGLEVAGAVVREPITINGRTYKPGSGPYEGFYSAGRGWVRIEGGQVIKPEGRSTGRTIGAVICLIVAFLAGLQGISWLTSYGELDAGGNTFAGVLALVSLGAFVVAAGFGVAGIVLLSRK